MDPLSLLDLRTPLITDGQMHYVPLAGQRSGKSGGYRINESGYGSIWNFKTGERFPIHPEGRLSPEEYRAMRERSEEQKRQRLARQEEAARKAEWIWAHSRPGAHPYLERKDLNLPLRIDRYGNLLVPLSDGERIWSLQRIKPDGTKLLMRNARKRGLSYAFDGATDPVFVAEGIATAASVHLATGCRTYMAIDANNILPVCLSLHYNRIVIAGDDDFLLPQRLLENVGRVKAEAAARAVSGLAVFPEGLNDWDDVRRAHGLEAVTQALRAAVSRWNASGPIASPAPSFA